MRGFDNEAPSHAGDSIGGSGMGASGLCGQRFHIHFANQHGIAVTGGEIAAQSTFEGPGINLNGLGNAICDWECGSVLFTPGSSVDPSFSQIDFGPAGPGGTLTLGGQQVVCQGQCALLATVISASSSITFPTNGQNFTVTVPAAVSELSGFVFGPAGVQPFNIQGSSGELVLFFAFSDVPSPSYQFEQAVFSTPEPGTLGLMMAGLAGILGTFKRRKRSELSH